MRAIYQDEEMLEGEIVIDEIVIQLVGKKGEETGITDETIKDMIRNMLLT